jgi:hypothetical protein
MTSHGPAGGPAEREPSYAATSYEPGNRNTNATDAPKAGRSTGHVAAPSGTERHRSAVSMVPLMVPPFAPHPAHRQRDGGEQ